MIDLATYTCLIGDRTHDVLYRPDTADVMVLRQIWQEGEYDLRKLECWPAIYRLYCGMVTDGMRPLIVDAGAHIGLASVWFAMLFPDSGVIAIEPEHSNLQLLVRNTEGLRVAPNYQALWSTLTRMTLVDPKRGSWGYRVVQDDDGSIQSTTLPMIYAQRPTDVRPFIVKLDIEGAEEHVMKAGWIAETPVVIAEIHDSVSMPVADLLYGDRKTFHVGENIVSVRSDVL